MQFVMKKNTKIFVNPNLNILYSSFYIKGLNEVFGKNNVTFNSNYFIDLNESMTIESYSHYFSFIIKSSGETRKIIVDFRDKTSVLDEAYLWCDEYYKINYNVSETKDKYKSKISSIAPSFAIRCWNPFETLNYAFSNYWKSRRNLKVSWKTYLLSYAQQYKRQPIKTYMSEVRKKDNYVFFISTLWNDLSCLENTNITRAKYINTVKSNPKINFEGGFFANNDHPQKEEFKELIFQKRYSAKEYISKTKESKFVYNTPAVWNCHGWKLGEYLMLGKAIISTPISNELPEELIHKKHIHIIQNMNELEQAINFILTNDEYRETLEKNALEYAKKWVTPKSVIEKILN